MVRRSAPVRIWWIHRPRLWFRPADMHYIQTGTITSSDVIVTTHQLARYTKTWVGGLVLHHDDHNCRPPWRDERRKEY